MDLVIVESPTKAKTLGKFLGKKFKVTASMGHVRDLPTKELGIDETTFEPSYVISPKAKKTAAELKKEAKTADKIYLATDPDREGEAIAWHVLNILTEKKKEPAYSRVVFHEITKDAVEESFEHPRLLDKNLIDAQQARRVLDRIVGYKLSPLLWKKVRYGLSAGRVQSVAVRLIVDREEERKNFNPQEYWSLDADFTTSKKENFTAFLSEILGKKPAISSQKEMDQLIVELKGVSQGATSPQNFAIEKVEKSEKKRNPYPPFTTSTLQQAASNRFGFAAKRTMSAAQKLFEEGHITYHRTDSLNLAEVFVKQARSFAQSEYGKDFVPETPNTYKTRSRNAQEAHEAIRPTDLKLDPKTLEATADEQKVYELIWQRALGSQMTPALFDMTSIVVTTPDAKYKFKANGSKLKFEGWLKVYGRSVEDEENGSSQNGGKSEEVNLPDVKEGESVKLEELKPEQHFTEPPARYTEASLIKALEEFGIGRPSTYAPTISTIQDRGYIVKENKQFVPMDVAVVVTHMLVEHFPEIVDYQFTANMEEELDKIAEGAEEWKPLIKNFYEPFVKDIKDKEEELSKKDMTVLAQSDEKCPECGKNLVVKLGKYGRFLSCSGFPECKYAAPVVNPNGGAGGGTAGDPANTVELVVDEAQLGKCEKCEDGLLTVKEGRFGKFIACTNYPKCKFTKPYLDKIGMKCPDCKDGEVIVKKGKFNKVFYGCSNYPKCKFVSNKDPRNKEEE